MKKQFGSAYVTQCLAVALRRVYDRMYYVASMEDKDYLDEHAFNVLDKYAPEFLPVKYEPFTTVVSTPDGTFICWCTHEIENAMIRALAEYVIRPATAEEKENFA